VCVCLRSGWLQSVCVQGGCRGREVRKKEKETREGEERRDAGGGEREGKDKRRK